MAGVSFHLFRYLLTFFLTSKSGLRFSYILELLQLHLLLPSQKAPTFTVCNPDYGPYSLIKTYPKPNSLDIWDSSAFVKLLNG